MRLQSFETLSNAFTILLTRGWRTMSSVLNIIVLMPLMFFVSSIPLRSPESSLFGRSTWLASPVTMNFASLPILVRNIFSCPRLVFCASSRMTQALSRVRPLIYAKGAIWIVPSSINSCSLFAGIISPSASYRGCRYGSSLSLRSPGRNPSLSPASTAGLVSMILLISLFFNALTARAMAIYVFPVPAGPIAYIRSFSIFSQLPVIMIGIILFFLIHESTILNKVNFKKFFSYCVLFVSVLMIVGEMYEKNSLLILSTATRYGIWFSGVILSQAIWQSCIINNVVFQKLGKNSYSIYLFHIFLITCFNRLMVFDFGNGIINWAAKFILVLLVSYLISILASRYIDQQIKCCLDKMKERF